MKNFIKYPTTSKEDKDWGLYINSAGSLKIPPYSDYPSPRHPSGYYFNWNQGRVLSEFQLNYITEGEGIFETKLQKFPIKPGSLLIIFPGEWHRYKPKLSVGWNENYIGFNGKTIQYFIQNEFFRKSRPVTQLGNKEEILDSFYKIFDLVEKEQPGFQFIASGLVVKILGLLVAMDKQKEFSGKSIAPIIEDARFKMKQQTEAGFNAELFANQHNISYSYFRKMFKNYTGISPRQYFIQLKIMRAKELLKSSNKSVKEISYELGFESIHYFSRLFKEKTGISPVNFRK